MDTYKHKLMRLCAGCKTRHCGVVSQEDEIVDFPSTINPCSIEKHFYHEFLARLDDFIDIGKALGKSED